MPELPRSGKRERPPQQALTALRWEAWTVGADIGELASPKTCQRAALDTSGEVVARAATARSAVPFVSSRSAKEDRWTTSQIPNQIVRAS